MEGGRTQASAVIVLPHCFLTVGPSPEAAACEEVQHKGPTQARAPRLQHAN